MNGTYFFRGLFGIGLGLVSASVYTHHSFRTEFDDNQPVDITGIVTRVEWTNPHGRFYVDEVQEDGSVVNWDFEMASPNILYRRGWRKKDLVPDDKVRVQAFRARKAEHGAKMHTLTRLSDGKDILDMTSPPE